MWGVSNVLLSEANEMGMDMFVWLIWCVMRASVVVVVVSP